MSHASSASDRTPTAAPTPMPALAPTLRDEDDDALVVVERGTVTVAVACWLVDGNPVDGKSADDKSVDDR